jgi:hypothetical protein
MVARRIRKLFLLPAVALLLIGAGCGSGSEPQEPAASQASTGADKRPGKVSAALQQQIADPSQQRPYSGGAPVRADGRIEVEFHAVGPVGAAETDALRRLGAEIVTTLSPDAVVPPAGVIVAWIPPDKVQEAAAAEWVAAVKPPGVPTTSR